MFNQPEKVLEQYDFVIRRMVKGRGNYICEAEDGMRVLLPFRGSKERAESICNILSRLNEYGWDAEQIFRTKEGEILAKDENENHYLVKSFVSGTECNPKSKEEMEQAVSLLAQFHKISRQYVQEVPECLKKEHLNPILQYEKHYRELVKVRNYIKARKRKNEFEMKFQTLYPHFMECAANSLEKLSKEELDLTGDCYGMCHGQFNQHNVIKTKTGFVIVNYEEMNYNPQIMDFVHFLRKMMEKNSWDENLGAALVESYTRIRPFQKREYQVLYLMLLFPEKFWKIANHYYNSHKAWLSGRDIEKLDKVMEQEEARMRFLEKIFSFVKE